MPALQRQDGSWLVPTTTEPDGGRRGFAMLPLTPEHPLYEQWMAWLGGHDGEKAFDPDQPRDEHGRWTDLSGSIARAARAGGGTLELSGKLITTGKVVALRGHSSITPDGDWGQHGRAATKRWLKDNADLLDEADVKIGVWHDTDHSEIVLDPVEVYADLQEAIRLGRERNQQSIYDLDEGREIFIGGTGDRPDQEKAHRGDRAAQEDLGDDRRGTRRAGRSDPWSGVEGDLAEAEAQLKARWEEQLHPRDRHGEFAPRPGAHGGPDLTIKQHDYSGDFPDPDHYPGGIDDPEFIRRENEYRRRRNEWYDAMQRAVLLGEISPEEAKRLKFNPMGGDEFKPLPPRLYHVTGAASAVRRDGALKPRRDVTDQGLGGGPDDVVSFTESPEVARGIRDSILELHAFVSDPEAGLATMIREATEGGYLPDVLRFYGGDGTSTDATSNRSWQDRIHFRKTKWMGLGMRADELAKDGFTPDPDSLIPGSNPPAYTMGTRSLTEPERRESIGELYQQFAAYREQHGGPLYPLFWMLNTEHMAALDPNDVQVVTVEPKPKALGTTAGALGEWRTIGEAVKIVGIEQKLDGKAFDERLHPRRPDGEFAKKPGIPGAHAMPDYSQSSLDQLERHHSDLTYGRGRFAKLSEEDRQRHLDAIEQALVNKTLEGDLEERAVAAQQLALFRMRVAPEFRRQHHPKPKLEPVGGIGKSITLPKSGKMREPAAQVLATIDGLVDVPALDEPIPLTVTSGRNKLGAYGRKLVGNRFVPEGIRLSTRNHPNLTLAHEVGHFIDSQHMSTVIDHDGKQLPAWGSFIAAARAEVNQGAGQPDNESLRAAIDQQPHQQEWDEWWAAIEASPEYDKLGTASFSNYGTHVYLRRPMEVWARAFSQWAAVRSGDPALMNDLEATRDPEQIAAHMKPHVYYRNFQELKRPATVDDVPDALRYRQWSDENFNRIGAAITTLMRAHGILKPRTPSSTNSSSTTSPIPSSPSGTGSSKRLPTFAAEIKRYVETQHPRDWHGRWAAIGARLGVTTTPKGKPRNPTKLTDDQAVANVVAMFTENETATQDARWYQDAHDQIAAWTEILNQGATAERQIDPQTFAAVVAACSANERWDDHAGKRRPKERGGGVSSIAGEKTFPNLRGAARAVVIYQKNPEGVCKSPEKTSHDLGKKKGLLGSSLIKSLYLLCGRSPDDTTPDDNRVLNGCKERSFYNCLCWPGGTDSVAIDRHAARILSNEPPPADSPDADKIRASANSYVWAEEMYRRATEQINAQLGTALTPDMVQAASWAHWRDLYEEGSRARPTLRKALSWQAQGAPLEVDQIAGQLVGEPPEESEREQLTAEQRATWDEIEREIEEVERQAASGPQPPT